MIGRSGQVPILPSRTGWTIINAMRRLCVLLLLVASHASAQQSPTAPRFRSGAEVIAIDVTVVEPNGSPVADLTAEDFTVTVEGP